MTKEEFLVALKEKEVIENIYFIGRKVNKNGKVSKKADKYNVFNVIYHIKV